MADIMDTDIGLLDLSVRTANCLRYEGLKTLADVRKYGESDLLQIPNFGRKSLNELNDLMAAYGLPAFSGRKQHYFAMRLSGEVFRALGIAARANGRSTEAEAAAIIGNAMGNPMPAASLAERVEKIEAELARMKAEARDGA